MTDLAEHLRVSLRDRYAIEQELGRGGMGCVFRARDLKHSRPVALKVLYPHLTNSAFAERFFREIAIVARLSHPNILPLHESGESAGCLFYVMPYVAGETLREWLRRDRQLPVETAVRLAVEIADALAYAHRQGVVHRDIKPENVLISEGHAVVADFGIASAAAADSGLVTAPGSVLGTPVYMSHEQATGETVDGRSDIYSLGCVLYEMLAGGPPFKADFPQALMARHAVEPIPDLRTRRPEVSASVSAAVTKALAKEPAARFRTAELFGRALADGLGMTAATGRPTGRMVSLGVLVAGLVLILAFGLWLNRSQTGSGRPAVAPLPGSADSTGREVFRADLRVLDARPAAGTPLTAAQLDRGVPIRVVVEQHLRHVPVGSVAQLGLWVQYPCPPPKAFDGGCWEMFGLRKASTETTQLALDGTLRRSQVVRDTVFVRLAISYTDSAGVMTLAPGEGTTLLLYPVSPTR